MATRILTQICFDAGTTANWAAGIADELVIAERTAATLAASRSAAPRGSAFTPDRCACGYPRPAYVK